MSLKSEITVLSKEWNLDRTYLTRDWVLSYFIRAMYSHPELKDTLIFKGGVCLRKCWFEKARFSKDLDFTSTSPKFVLTADHVAAICDNLKQSINVIAKPRQIEVLFYNERDIGYQVLIDYSSSNVTPIDLLTESGTPPAPISIQITVDERICMHTIIKRLSHFYLDKDKLDNVFVISYSSTELLAEKIRATITRKFTSPKDYYDLWLFVNENLEVDFPKAKTVLIEKLKYRGIEYPNISDLLRMDKIEVLRRSWEKTLRSRLQKITVPDLDLVISDLNNFLSNLQ